ncbi:unnamed protein product [Lactuca virosa]|uniref:Uncharacterized protein n=1 Tax=Lactuca virosa TaxID=75947 RepID=A0AAU9LVS8_9ASTR|nr:unnamed protein product [Lactuca virosa]
MRLHYNISGGCTTDDLWWICTTSQSYHLATSCHVQAEHLAKVKGKGSGVSTRDGQDSATLFYLLGDLGSSQGWMDGGASSEPGGGGRRCNTGGQATERSLKSLLGSLLMKGKIHY